MPRREVASDRFLAAITRYDTAAAPAALDSVLATASAFDAITLWHLLPRVPASDRARVAERIAALVEVPSETPVARVAALEPAALDAWWNALGFGEVEFWRTWESARPPGR